MGAQSPSRWPDSAHLQTHRGSASGPKCQGTEVTQLCCSLILLPPKGWGAASLVGPAPVCLRSPLSCGKLPFPHSQEERQDHMHLLGVGTGSVHSQGWKQLTVWAMCRGDTGIDCSALPLMSTPHPPFRRPILFTQVVQRWLPLPAIKAPCLVGTQGQ